MTASSAGSTTSPADAATSDDASERFAASATPALVANLAALWAGDPAFAAEVEAALDLPPYEVEPSRSGPPTLALNAPDGRRLYLHSRHDPVAEAARLAGTLGEELDRRSAFVLYGLGLGYALEAVAERAGDEAMIVVVEPDLRLIRTAMERRDLSGVLSRRRVIFLTRPDRAQVLLKLAPVQALFALGSASLVHPPSAQLHGAFHAQVRTWLEEYDAFCRTGLSTLVLNGRRTAENVARNLPWYVAAPSINRLRGRHAGWPAIIVSAGPSLRKNLHLLPRAQGKAVIIAVQTTLQPLLDVGVTPDYATSLDYHEISTRFFERLPRGLTTELVAEPKASAAVFDLYPGPVSLLGNELADKLLGASRPEKDRLRAGATVAHLAFYLAEYLGCDPIIFVGQDLAFSDGLAYVPGTSYEDVWRPELGRFCTVEMRQWEHIARERPILRRVEGQGGEALYTEERLFAYLQQFERDFATTSARVIDATEGGALKRRTEPMPLERAIEELCARPLPPAARDHPGLNWDLLPRCAEAIEQRRAEAGRVREIAAEALPLLEEMRDHLDDQARANRLIARLDALRARMAGLDDCYQLVMQLTQQTELSRFRSDHALSASKASGIDRQRQQLERDLANVRAVIEASGQFLAMLDEVAGVVEDARHRRQEQRRQPASREAA